MTFGDGAFSQFSFAETSEILTVVAVTGVSADVALGTVTVTGTATVTPTGVAADAGEMDRKARSRDRPMRMARRGTPERSARKVLAMTLGMSVWPMSWSPGC